MISVIIPTYNEESVILDCLTSLAKQTYKDYEIIVVDDGSSDKTLEIVKNVKILQQKHLGPGAGRNLGAKSAKGDILVFVDSDMTFDENFLKMLIKPILAGQSKGTFSKDENVSNWDNVWARCYNINEGWMDKRRHPNNYPSTQKVFRAIKTSEFFKVGGFTAGGYNDDWSLSEKLGYEANLAEKAIFYHKNPESLKEIFNHAQWVGKRSYKLYVLGYMIALLRSSFPVSLVLGLLYAIWYRQYAFIIFKTIYDFGVFIGILKFVFTNKGSK
ncbi:MAG: glycosyl transferase family protein [uncultured bacterium]|nr:MAG: glycosyl transferase family protein [uncultured bacterium]